MKQKLIKFCNLDWEDNCIDHTKNKTGIKTVSLAQARNLFIKVPSIYMKLILNTYLFKSNKRIKKAP